MSVVLKGLLPLRCLVYLDDVLVTGRSFEQHLENLEAVLEAISKAGLKPSKCHFAQSSVDFIGFTTSDSGLAPDCKKVEAISRYPTPKDLTELRRFLEPNGDYILYTDASDVEVGAVLVQEDGEGELYLVHRKRSQALKWLKNVKHPNGKLARWILKLEEYDYTIEHKPGNMMQHADALSRAPVNSIRISTLSWTELEETQNMDDDILLVRRWVLNGLRPDAKSKDTSPMLKALYNVFESLVVEKNVLCRKWIDEDGKETLQFVVPKLASPAILKDAHQQVGHLGIAKTFEMIQRRFYWPGFYKDVETFCKSCEICARNKVVPRPRSPMKPIDIVPVQFYMIGVDLIGFEVNTSKYVSVVWDRKEENYRLSLTDGLCERFNGILKTLLRMRVNNDKDDWDEQVPHALPAYRVSKQSSTGATPFEMLYGRDPRLPLGVEPEELETEPTRGPAKYLEDLKKRQNNMRKIVLERIEQSQKKQKRCYDSRNRACRRKDFSTIGDTVLLKNFRARGLNEKYVGPYLVVDVQDTSCEIEPLANKTRKIVHANNLKRFSIDYDIDQVYEESEDAESSECDFDEIGNELPNPEERQNVQRNDDGANVMHGYNLRHNRRVPDRYGIPVVDY
ncbi:Transposon Ty3-G Gag-Pol poly [Paramuricea clavata]|uniref:Transposon Ty3-G Gag-Pol poly n=1 Tax=Paramuricea clavata TaxID=317549 RepID=A0A7D9DCY4_PARCT|nr:Transposon Ty3-G Gag-Pol poly [Paramuricea clavata]